jgi:hypothetical protein
MIDTALSAQEQFFADLRALPRYTEEDRQRFATLACQGDRQARNAFVESMIPYIVKYASRLVVRFPHLTLLEIVQIGNMLLVENVDRSLWVENPCSFLLTRVKYEMLYQCIRYATPISTPRQELPRSLVSLDQPVQVSGSRHHKEELLADLLAAASDMPSDRDYTFLYDALARLSKDRQELLARWFGLFDYPPPASPQALAHEMLPDLSPEKAYDLIYMRVERALQALNMLVASAYLPGWRVPEEFYTATDLRERFGVGSEQLRRWVMKGRLTRYPAPDGLRCPLRPYVYDRAEVEVVVKDWQQGKLKPVRQARAVEPGETEEVA